MLGGGRIGMRCSTVSRKYSASVFAAGCRICGSHVSEE
jgi:hypothetical protein